MWEIAICDDEPYMLAQLAAQIGEFWPRARLRTLTNAAELLAAYDQGWRPDMVFLDIKMPPPDGMQAAQQLRRLGFDGFLIFITILPEYVFKAFEVQAFDYLLKPVQPEALARLLNRLEQHCKTVVIQKGAVCEVLPLAQIVYCEVQGRKIYLHQNNGSVIDFYDKLEVFAQRVDGRFFRCHRSYLVNLDYVHGCGAGQIRLATGAEIPVSRLRERDLRQALLCHMKKVGNIKAQNNTEADTAEKES